MAAIAPIPRAAQITMKITRPETNPKASVKNTIGPARRISSQTVAAAAGIDRRNRTVKRRTLVRRLLLEGDVDFVVMLSMDLASELLGGIHTCNED